MIQLKHILMAAAAVAAAPTLISTSKAAVNKITLDGLHQEHCNPDYGKYVQTVRHGGQSYELHCG